MLRFSFSHFSYSKTFTQLLKSNVPLQRHCQFQTDKVPEIIGNTNISSGVSVLMSSPKETSFEHRNSVYFYRFKNNKCCTSKFGRTKDNKYLILKLNSEGENYKRILRSFANMKLKVNCAL